MSFLLFIFLKDVLCFLEIQLAYYTSWHSKSSFSIQFLKKRRAFDVLGFFLHLVSGLRSEGVLGSRPIYS